MNNIHVPYSFYLNLTESEETLGILEFNIIVSLPLEISIPKNSSKVKKQDLVSYLKFGVVFKNLRGLDIGSTVVGILFIPLSSCSSIPKYMCY